MRITIKIKLIFLFVIIVLLMIMVSFVSLHSLNRFDKVIEEVIVKEQPILDFLSDTKEDLLISRLKLSQYVATGNKVHLQSMKTNLDRVSSQISFIKEQSLSEKEKELLHNTEQAFNSYKIMVDSLISYYEKNPDDLSTISLKESRLDAILDNALILKLNLIHESKQEKIFKAGEQIRVSSSQFFLTILLVTFFAIIVGAVSSLLIEKSITSPLHDMVVVVSDIAKGDFSKKIKTKSRDELGDLSSAFNSMTDDLKKAQMKIKLHEKELKQQVEKRTKELQSKLDQLEKLNKFTIGRELRMVELKKKIKELEKELKKQNKNSK